MTYALAILGLIAVSAFLLLVAWGFFKGAEEAKGEEGCGMVVVGGFLVILVAHIWIMVLTAGQ